MTFTPGRFLFLSLFLLLLTYLTWLASMVLPAHRESKALESMRGMVWNVEVHKTPPYQSILAFPLLHFRPEALQRVRSIRLYAETRGHAVHLERFPVFSRLEEFDFYSQEPGFTAGLRYLHQVESLQKVGMEWNTSWGSLEVLNGLPVESLHLRGSVGPGFNLPAGLPLKELGFHGNVQSDLAFLDGFPVEQIYFYQNAVLGVEAFERIAALPHLGSLRLKPTEVLGTDAIAALGQCPNLSSLTVYGEVATVEGLKHLGALQSCHLLHAPADLSPLAKIPTLDTLNLARSGIDQVESLKGATNIRYLLLSGEGFDDDERLAKALDALPRLGDVDLSFSVSKTLIEGLKRRGIGFSHEGVKAYTLEEDVLHLDGRPWAVDLSKSWLHLHVEADTGRVVLSLEAGTNDPYGGNVEHPFVSSPQFLFDVNSEGLVGRVSTLATRVDEAHAYYNGIFVHTEDNRVEILGLKGSTLALQWSFAGEYRGRLNVRLPLPPIKVTSANPIVIEDAQNILERHFPGADVIVAEQPSPTEVSFRVQEDAP